MSLSHADYRLACRERALTLSVCTTGSTTLVAVAAGYTRASGSFVTDGFRAGMEVTPTGFTQTSKSTITAVTAGALTIDGGRTAQASGAGRTLAVGLPAKRAWENIETTIVAGAPYVRESYLPGTLNQDTVGPLGWMEATAIYQLDVSAPQDTGPDALDRYADALTVHFSPRLSLTTADGTVIRVRADGGLTRSPIFPADRPGFSTVAVSIPLRIRTPNTL